MTDRAAQIAFLREFFSTRAWMWYHGHIRRDPLARLHLAEGRENPYPLYNEIRARGPLSPTPLANYQTVSHRVCNSVLRDRRFGVEVEQRPGNTGDHKLSFLEMDPPDHTRLRRFAAPSFSPRQISGYRDRIQGVVDSMLDRVRPGEAFDLVTTFAAPMPIAVITDLLGIPDANAEEFAHYGTTIGSALSGIQSIGHAKRLIAAEKQLARIFAEVFELKRRDPGDDVISRMVAADAQTVLPKEFVPLCTLLLIAGFETTVNLIGNTVLALLDHPDQWRTLCQGPDLADRAVEETLRWDAPVQRTVRSAREQVDLAGKTITRGQLVILMLGGANRDPEVFPDPDRFDLMRTQAVEHLAFSSGIHYCLGAPLAKLEATLAVRSLAERFPELSRAGRTRRRSGDVIRGMSSFPVRASRAVMPATR